jgi:cellulose synthase/poly-beta-1,6-N-acetylglucosamine synthase-like glycosyltransferase
VILGWIISWGLLAVSTAIAFWILIGYPLFLKLVPPKGAPVHRAETTPTVTVLMAVHNGEAFLRPKLDSLLALDYPADRREILVLGDGCTDASESIVRANEGVRWIQLERGGKAAALNAGLQLATGEILFFTDVRQKLDPQALRQLVANFADPQVGAVTGELRILKPGAAAGEQEDMDLYWRYELWARRWHSAEYSMFNTTGCLYAMRRALARPILPDTLIDDAEIPLQAYQAGFRIVFDDRAIAFDYATVAGGEWRRRMRTMAGMWQVYARNPGLLFRPHRMWLHFTSHKLGRVLLPWALLGTVAGAWNLPDGWFRTSLLGGNAAFLGLALAARMGGAALLSLRVFFSDARQMWSQTTSVDARR